MDTTRFLIRITGAPIQQYGEPEEVRRAWVGAILPAEMSFPGIFQVDPAAGINGLFALGSYEAVTWWRNRYVIEGDRAFTFPWLCCYIIHSMTVPAGSQENQQCLYCGGRDNTHRKWCPTVSEYFIVAS